ncbi:MAG: acetamidase/formamidase family protein [Chloroflexi bacterium]|nr:acetamidase/formamidase family protein [Chloroflexota bacterium]
MTTHHIRPDRYHHTLGSHPPLAHIASGDTVVTTTVDAAGRDADGVAVTPRGNPMTGPFFVAGARPGDTLVIEIEQLEPNRATGFSGWTVAPNVLDPQSVAHLPVAPAGWATWQIDRAAGIAQCQAEPGGRTISVPLRPMLGCFGVAPARGQAISTATSGEHGGNMDYNGFVAGTRVSFPVFCDGALFFLGDGHAAQGDGEIVGTGIEVSLDVRFTVRLIAGQTIGWPRGEHAEAIFTVGNARPLDQCVQHATSEMLAWLTSEYRLTPLEACMLLGQAARYDLGNIFDPAYTMVCRLARTALAGCR